MADPVAIKTEAHDGASVSTAVDEVKSSADRLRIKLRVADAPVVSLAQVEAV